MSIFDKMMETDFQKLAQKEQAKMEVKRLSGVFGEPFIVTCTPISEKSIAYVSEMATSFEEQKIYTLLECCSVEGKRFRDKAFLEWTGALTETEVVKKLFLPGEVQKLYSKVSDLSGYGKDAIEELKN